MTDIEHKALELVNAERLRRGWYEDSMDNIKSYSPESFEALCRALEAHEADKARYEARTSVLLERDARHAAEMREQAERFSEFALGVKEYMRCCGAMGWQNECDAWILVPEPTDPLAEAIEKVRTSGAPTDADRADILRAALDARGLAIVKKEAVNG